MNIKNMTPIQIFKRVMIYATIFFAAIALCSTESSYFEWVFFIWSLTIVCGGITYKLFKGNTEEEINKCIGFKLEE